MIISHRHKFIFLRVPKTASTSIQMALSEYCGTDDILSKLSNQSDPVYTEADYRGAQGNQQKIWAYTLDDWYKLLIKRKTVNFNHAGAKKVRKFVGPHVWEQYYKFCFVRNPFDRAISLYYWRLKKWQTSSRKSISDINEFILSVPNNQLSTWEKYTINNKIEMDFIGRFENLTEDIKTIANKIGTPALEIPHAKSSVRSDGRHYSEIINARARTHIEKVCSSEISAFGYYWETMK